MAHKTISAVFNELVPVPPELACTYSWQYQNIAYDLYHTGEFTRQRRLQSESITDWESKLKHWKKQRTWGRKDQASKDFIERHIACIEAILVMLVAARMED
jgi:hypothetical protein